MKTKPLLTITALLALMFLINGCDTFLGRRPVVILVPREASFHEKLAASEIRRYVYLRTGAMLDMIEEGMKIPKNADLIIPAHKERPIVLNIAEEAKLSTLLDIIDPEHYLLKSVEYDKRRVLLVTSGDALGVLYGAYRFAEKLGIRFSLYGDIVPDRKTDWAFPVLNDDARPLFAIRGIQPFHDFPEGPDWWTRDDYRAVIAQLPKLGMNFFGLHCYPEGGVGPEPTVWIGLGDDTRDDGTVTFSYPSRYFSTPLGAWGYESRNTGEFLFGSHLLFETDGYASTVMEGAVPLPETPEKSNDVFNRTGILLDEAFTFAHRLGVKTCVGTETPLTIPKALSDRLKNSGMNTDSPQTARALYEGMFTRIANTFDIDYYWFWTPEDWTWGGNSADDISAVSRDLQTAIEAADAIQAPFKLATSGWVLGPQSDRALFDRTLPKDMPMSCINRYLGMSPVDPAFGEIERRPTWAIPWVEDDPALTAPQLWAGRMRADAVDARAYGCSGLIGIHWRTRNIDPTLAALAGSAWIQRHFKPKEPPFGPLGENVEEFTAGYSATGRPISGTEDDPLYQTVRHETSGYLLDVPPGVYTITLKFCETRYDRPGLRVFDINLQGEPAKTGLDIAAQVGRDAAFDLVFKDVIVLKGGLRIDFVPNRDYPIIAGIEVKNDSILRRINCGGPAYNDYEADTGRAHPRDLDVSDFYNDWALTRFGPEASNEISLLFQRLDGALPRPAQWTNGPGGVKPDPRSWDEVAPSYTFVDELEAFRPRIEGAGNLERFDWWLGNFTYMRNLARLRCAWGRFNVAMETVNALSDPADQKAAAERDALPLFNDMHTLAREVMTDLLTTVSTPGELGTVANLNQHAFPNVFSEAENALREVLKNWAGVADSDAKKYAGNPRLIVPAVHTLAASGESLDLTAIVLDNDAPQTVEVLWRPLGEDKFETASFDHVNRGVYRVSFPADGLTGDIEYYVKAVGAQDKELVFPPSAPGVCQTVVVMPE